jgi:hypothetical protein
MRQLRATTNLRIPAARNAGRCGRTGAQRLRERVARAAPVRVPVELAADCVPEAPGGVVNVRLTATVHTCARDGRQAYARRLGLEPRIVLRAVVAVCAADLECCKAFRTPPRGMAQIHAAQHMWPGREGHGPCSEAERRAAVPPGGLSAGAVAFGPAVAATLAAAALSLQEGSALERIRADTRRRRSACLCARGDGCASLRALHCIALGRVAAHATAAHRRTAAARWRARRQSHDCSGRRRRRRSARNSRAAGSQRSHCHRTTWHRWPPSSGTPPRL